MRPGQMPFADVRMLPDGFSLPELKWREMLFVGALRPDGDAFVRDPDRVVVAAIQGDVDGEAEGAHVHRVLSPSGI